MITPEQEKWLSHLNDSNSIEIFSFDTTTGEKFEKVKKQIQKALGDDIAVEHRGATGLGISGQDEIDIYIPALPENWDSFIFSLTKLFGEPRSHYVLERARFVTTVDEKHVDVFLINSEHSGWLNLLKFEKYLKENPEELKVYENLKESLAGLSTQAYYRKKIEYINDILSKAS